LALKIVRGFRPLDNQWRLCRAVNLPTVLATRIVVRVPVALVRTGVETAPR